ncbi:uncharacterized protein BBA_01448 [Beauveria bassiana ARSEF 2860]|uniref:Uncharacterized protein n=1 Tax=Beauveria bassiana (strain ARSEF 2860) TaxID=655819 RepID=J5JYF0_BEAB2|nr:uncharacterized protein BBA_01448 [Beauveria bassiana ARSEF 2860]EJP69483.1 hypothetical protein BBA_01448 [Beauveria bassiana ARSEF 2860]
MFPFLRVCFFCSLGPVAAAVRFFTLVRLGAVMALPTPAACADDQAHTHPSIGLSDASIRAPPHTDSFVVPSIICLRHQRNIIAAPTGSAPDQECSGR